MRIPITLDAAHFIHHDTVITLPEERIELQIIPTAFSVGDIIVGVHNGAEGKEYKYNGGLIDITPLCKRAGEVTINITLSSRGHVLKRWKVENLALREISGGIEAIPQITALEKRIDVLEKALLDLIKIIR